MFDGELCVCVCVCVGNCFLCVSYIDPFLNQNIINPPKKMTNRSKFITGQEELSTLPNDVQDLFILIREEDFRVDISSTELRKQASSSSAMMDE
mmetsp:Transcript_34695/g.46548  ORF Transcript_34695/g.46548 Transcript_34695/m.46548 type:complete len:94 (-) Transcript_34695:731-1012(-)